MTALASPTSARGTSAAHDDNRPVARGWLWFWAVVIALAYGLLWSPNWYPLSDSSLYLSMARSFAAGRGLTMMGDPVRLVPPLTPLFLGSLMKLGAGIGTLQAAQVVLMLISHALCFLTLRRWLNERLALGATLASAFSYWVFANAFTIMSEPLCMAMMWGAFLTLTYVRPGAASRWPLILLSCGLLVLAVGNRDAVLCLLPGPLLALLLRARGPGQWWREPMKWGAVFALTLGSWFVYRYPPRFFLAMFAPKAPLVATTTTTTRSTTTQSTTAPVAVVPPPAIAINPEFEAEPDSGSREGRYRAGWFNGVRRDWHMVTEPPVLGGRWVCEGMVMAAVGVFESKHPALKVFGTTAALVAFALAIAGAVVLLWRGHWWVLGPALYFAFIWAQWGTRIKPRYMIPIAPLLFLFLWCGLTSLVTLIARRGGRPTPDAGRIGRLVLAALLGVVFLGNAFPWAVEVYVRHGPGGEFYDVARRSAYAGLVDIGGYAHQHIPDDQTVWTNGHAHRRIAHFLTGRRIETTDFALKDWNDWEQLLTEHKPGDPTTRQLIGKRHLTYAQRRARFFHGIARNANYLIVFVDHPKPGESWPGWHLPTGAANTQLEFWRLYQRQADDTWKQVPIPKGRAYVRAIPTAGL